MPSKSLFNKLKEILQRENTLIALSVLFISCVFSPYLYWGEDTYLLVLDNIEVNLTWVKMVLDAGGLLPPNATIEQVMNGIPLAGVYGIYDINLLLFHVFGVFGGYAISKYLMAIIGFFGMYLLLKRFVIPGLPLYIPAMVALLFSLLPFWSFTASVSGTPFVFFAFLNLRKGNKSFSNWLILIIYAFYSSLILTGVFVLLILFALFVYDIVKNRKINFLFFSGLICLTVAYIISHLPLFVNNFDPNFVSVREEFTRILNPPLRQALKQIYILFVDGNDSIYYLRHTLSLQRYFIIPTVGIVLFLMLVTRKINKLFVGILIFIGLTSVLYTTYEMTFFYPIRHFFMKILPLNLARITWLHPLCWYLLLALAYKFLYQKFSYAKYLIPVLFILQLIYIVPNQDHFYYKDRTVSFGNFFAEKQFQDIKAHIGKPEKDYRVINVGMHPSIAQHNGLYTLDGYMINYPLSYKHQFRKVIAKELDRTEYFKKDFDTWGGRCYPWSSEIHDNTNFLMTEFPEIQLLDYDYEQLKAMGGEYILSTAKINTEINSSLQLLKKFEASDYERSNWNIYLYKVL